MGTWSNLATLSPRHGRTSGFEKYGGCGNAYRQDRRLRLPACLRDRRRAGAGDRPCRPDDPRPASSSRWSGRAAAARPRCSRPSPASSSRAKAPSTATASSVRGPGRERGVVFQELAILPWRTVRRNIGHGLEIAGLPKAERDRKVTHLIELTGLIGFEDRYPHELPAA